jgi:uncharacterized glyoxalase superfamily protein PhnB
MALPPGSHTLTPQIIVADGDKAIDHYKKALGAKEMHRILMPGSKSKVMHAALEFGDSTLFLSDEMGQMKAPKNGKGGSSFYLYVDDVDKAHRQAIGAGMTATMPPTDMFWGDRISHVMDPFGHSWSLATRVRDVSPEDMERGKEAWAASMAPPKAGQKGATKPAAKKKATAKAR